MFDYKHYVSAMKWKRGERETLRQLAPDVKAVLTPLIEVVPIVQRIEGDESATSAQVEAHLDQFPKQIAESWGVESPLFIDLDLMNPGARMESGRVPLEEISERCAAIGVHMIPVTGFDREGEQVAAARIAADREGNGICVRVSADDLFVGDLASDLKRSAPRA